MQRAAVGSYTSSIAGGETVRAFVPAALPPVPPLELTGTRQALLEQATLALGRLDSVSTLLPDPQLFLYAYVRREAVLSSQIEGTQSSLSDLLLFELGEVPGVPFDDVVEVSNYIAALEHGMARLREGFPLCNRLLREMHSHLMARGRGSDKLPGEFRRSQNWIGGTRPGNAHFVPPPPHEVEPCMAALESFIHGENNPTPVLLKAALAHVQFETIHPFLDGNGRLGRLLIALLLHQGGLLAQPLLYLSLYFKQHRAVYYELLDRVRTHGDWEAWVDFFLEGVEQTAQGAVQTAQRLVALFQQDTERSQSAGRGAANAQRVLHALRRRPMCGLKQLCQDTGMTFPTASKAMQTLVGLGIARELTGQRRNRVFVYDTYLNILNEGGGGVVRPGYKQTEVGVIPEDWDVGTIGDLQPFVTSGSRGWAAFYSDQGESFIRITNLTRDSIYLDLNDLRYVSIPTDSSEGARTQLQNGDVLISVTADIGIVGYVSANVRKPAYINQHIALVRFDPAKTNPKFVSYYLASEKPQKRFRALTDAGAKAGMNLTTVRQIRIALPSRKAEQEAIAEALSDADALIESLEQLITKKRQIKQGTMQELLTGKKRLPGFNGEWGRKLLGAIAYIKTGSRNNQDKVEDGDYPFFVRSAIVERINSYSYDCEAILVPGEGGIGSIFHYINGQFDVHQRVYAITQFAPDVSGKYVYLYMSVHFGAHAMQNSVKATVDSLRLPTFQEFEIDLPPTEKEQTAIATLLSDMDTELAALEAKLAKARQLKQGMMQELLTGRIRLVPPAIAG